MDWHLFNNLKREESKFYQSMFLAPVVNGGKVRVRIEKIVSVFNVQPPDFTGWGIFRSDIKHPKTAFLVKEADFGQIKEYLELFPKFELVVCCCEEDNVFGILANEYHNIKINGMVPVFLANECQLLDTIVARFDGTSFWFDELCFRKNPIVAESLRNSLSHLVRPESLKIPESTRQDREAYAIAYMNELNKRGLLVEEKVREKLSEVGAQLEKYEKLNRGNISISYTIDGKYYMESVISVENFEVVSAGICLSGQDRKFDLQSLVGVLREYYN